MIKEALLGLLASQPLHGYELKLELDRILGRTTPVNVGQVYTALAKLEKEGLVITQLVSRDDQRAEMKVYAMAPEGADHLSRWFAQPVERVDLRDELFIKLSLARRTGADVAAILQAQRLATLRSIQELTLLRERLEGGESEEITLLIDGAILHLEADMGWLDLWEQRLLKGRTQR